MKYFLDTEFLEGTQKSWFSKNTKSTIDLISIGIVCEDGREYYAISKDFNLKEAWNRYDEKVNRLFPIGPEYNKVYWIRENVLKPIWKEKCKEDFTFKNSPMTPYGIETLFNYKNFKKLINRYGKTNEQIAEEVKSFCKEDDNHIHFSTQSGIRVLIDRPDEIIHSKHWSEPTRTNPEFYGYYCDYDWVVFCWLFGKMIDLPKGFPMYCNDLKQTLDEKAFKENKLHQDDYILDFYYGKTKDDMIDFWKKHYPNYPKQTNEHNALADAHWNKELYNFLNNL